MEDNPSNIKEETLSLNPKKMSSEKSLNLNPIIPQEAFQITEDPTKIFKPADPSPTDKPKKHLMFQGVNENDRRDSKLQEMLREKRQSFLPPGNSKGPRASSPIKSAEKEVDVFKVKDEIKNKRIILLERFLESKAFQIPVAILTIYALFFGDIKYLISAKSDDTYFDAITYICMGVFIFEIILSMMVKKNYTFSFFFWLDIISTATLIFDLSIVSTKLL